MSQSDKAAYYNALKTAGVQFSKHYREYSTQELAQAYTRLREAQAELASPEGDPVATSPMPPDDWAPAEDLQQAVEDSLPEPTFEPAPEPQTFLPPPLKPMPLPEPAAVLPPPAAPAVPVGQRDPNELPGQRINSKPEDEPIRVDELGRVWFQEEVRKPAVPKPRGRRVLTYVETGTETRTEKIGDYVETFEVAGEGAGRPAEIKITLPSYQVGIYKDPRFPFRIHCYNGVEGFDLFEVQDYYGGAELVPAECKRTYVENSLCYDIRTVVRAIETEYRQLQLQGKA